MKRNPKADPRWRQIAVDTPVSIPGLLKLIALLNRMARNWGWSLCLLPLLAGCDKSTTVTWQASGTANVVVEGSAIPAPAPVPGPQPTPQPTPAPVPAGYDLNTNAALVESFDKRLDPLGLPDAVALGPLGIPWSWQAPEGFTRSNSCYRWTAALVAPVDGEYTFEAKLKSGGSIAFDGESVWAVDREMDATSDAKGFTVPFTRTLTKGKLYPIRCHVAYQGFLFGFDLTWKRPDREAAEPVATAFLHPPADWQSRLKAYVPPVPAPLPYIVPDAAYQSPDITLPAHQPIDTDDVDPLSDKIIAGLGSIGLHPVFGPGVGIPFELVEPDAPRVGLAFFYAAESDVGPYPLPAKPIVEAPGTHLGGDGHWIGYDGTQIYELFAVSKSDDGWAAHSGAIFDRNGTRVPGWKPGWTSGDAAGLCILRYLLTYQEFAAGEINHPIRVSVPIARRAFVAPATHFTIRAEPDNRDDKYPPMGAVLRLKAGFDETPFPETLRPIIRCLKRHGMIVCDNGGPFCGLIGTPDARWDNDLLAALKAIKADQFEVVKMPPIVTEVP